MGDQVSVNGAAAPEVHPGAELWRHKNPAGTQMFEFMTQVNQKYGKNLKTYKDLHQWSIEDISDFWSETWHYVGIRASKPFNKAISDENVMFPRPAFFPGAELNFAENLLYPAQEVDPSSVAIISANEVAREQITWAELRERVRSCQAGMLATGLGAGDRVGGFVANHTNALVAMLAATSLGAIWTAVSPDTGVTAVLDRMTQIEPTIFLCDNAVIYNGKKHPTLPKVEEICSSLPTVKKVVILETIADFPIDLTTPSLQGRASTFGDFCSAPTSGKMTFTQLSPDHPIYILYSSGTTGKPKPIVHGAIGTLLQHKKEHMLQCDIRPGDRMFYYSSTTWMMWHWLVSGLASGATLVLYDGSPFRSPAPSSTPEVLSVPDDLAMPRLIDELKITHFGTSAKYLSILEGKSLFPRQAPHNLSLNTLRAIYSTGSPLAPSTFSYVYSAFGPDINLGSITGGTDIISLFGAPCPLTPVYCGEIQVLGLGMAVQAWDFAGNDVSSTGEPGDLVCMRPFVCQPIAFWGGDGEKKYKSSYFEMFEGKWHHGDFVRFNPETGGVYMLGRSDGILKPGGVRFGSAEIYNLVLQHFGKEVEDALCIGRRRETDTDETVVLFLKMMEGQRFTDDLVQRVKGVVRKELSARHVPGIVVECPEIPVTVNGKK
ncbi:Acetyl-coenzyme A synthetase [Sphaceloma murrayae]|uniref:Acetyl-coenzyme A synthetase n=1 Tax=Sphaceloma murrayae TaxID=2082308 RepID=A0A2K1QWB9_9PEZI|nr:Acetyl-coenzyme A synthetase [Sphaceloma murrayae]